ncbi:MAG: hypothetical protein GX444_00785 [Myxococcales bacterium]|nr:hypothetical protein [Myxococcales bacterium]
MKTVKMLALLMLVAAVAGAAVSGALILAEKGVIHVDSLAVSAPGLQNSVAATQPANQATVRKVRFIDRIRGLRDVFKPVKEDPQTPPPLEAALGDWVEYSSLPLASIPHKAYYPTVIYDAAGFGTATPLYRMWYDAASSCELYSSTDGITWTRVGSLSGLSGNQAHTTVKYFSSGFTGANSGTNPSSATMKYRIWYWHDLAYAITDIYYAESADGLVWYNDQPLQQGSVKVVGESGEYSSATWNRGSYGSVEVLYNASATNSGTNPYDYTFAMYYDGSNGGKESIGLAYSANGILWTPYDSDADGYADPVLAGAGYQWNGTWDCPAGCAWDCGYVSRPTVFKTATGFEMWYSGGITTMNLGIGHAVSRDGLVWTRDPRGAIFTVSDGVAWRDDRTYASWVVNVNGALKMWFSGRDYESPNEYRLGLATPANWTFFVDGSWSGKSDGEEVVAGSGKYYGFNAFSSIQRAIDVAANGTTIQIAAGTYTEFVNVNKSVTLIGADQNDPTADPMITNQSLTIIQPPATGSATTDAVLKVVASNATISHLTVTGDNGGLHARYGIYVVNTGGLGLHDIVVQYCTAYGFSNVPSGGDYYTSDSSSGNTQGGGIYVEGISSPLPTAITLDRNIVHDVYFGMYLDTSDGTISNNYVYNSEAAISTWGIGTGSTTRYLIDNTIENSGRALLVNGVNSGNPVVFSGNKATNVVRGLEARYSRQLITIENNEIQATTTGMLLKPQDIADGYLIRNNTITGTNAVGSIGIDAYAYNSIFGTVLTAVVENNDLSGFETGIRAFKDPSYIATRTIELTIGGAAGKTNVIRATGGDNHSLLLQNCNNAITATYNDWGAYPESRILHQVDNGALGLVTFNPWAGGCYVDGNWYENGDGNPVNPCQACNSSLDITVWSNAADGISCEGLLFCADGETCSAGVCGGGTPIVCSDGVDCTVDSCDEATDSCESTPNNAACNDGNPCTDDVCDIENGCMLVMNTASCDDGIYCNGTDTCSGGSCHSAGNPCPENGNVCDGMTSCDEAGDQCVTSAAPTCNDGLYCNGVETCDPASGCVAGTPPDCAIDDHISCTIDACDEATDQCAHTYDPAVNPCVVSAGGSIQTAINIVNPGTTIQVAAGTFAESLTINKKIILEGAGSGDDPATATIIDAPGTGTAAQKGAFIRASGTSASDRLTVKDLRFTDSYAGIYFDTSVSHIAIDNVVATAGVNGLEFEAAGGTIITVTDLAVSDSSFDHNIEANSGMGIRVSKRATIDGLQITNSHFDFNNRGWYAQRTTTDGVTDITNVLVEDSTFDNNGYKAINLEKLSNATFSRISVDSSGACPIWYNATQPCNEFAAGLELNLKYANYANITVENSTFNASGMMSSTSGAALAFKARDDGSYSGANAATLSNVTVRGNFFSGNQNALFLGEPGKNNLTPTNVVIEHNSFTGSLAKEIQNNCQTTPNASANWFGETDGVLVAGKLAGTLDYTPWLDTGDDQSTAPGFQADLSVLHVDDAGAQLPSTLGRISEAVDLVYPGGSVSVEAGTYAESVAIAKSLTLTAPAGAANTFLTGALNSASHHFYMMTIDADDVTVDGFDMSNAAFTGGWYAWAIWIGLNSDLDNIPTNVRVTNCAIHDIGTSTRVDSTNGYGPTYGLNITFGKHIEIDHNAVYNIARQNQEAIAIGAEAWDGTLELCGTDEVNIHDNVLHDIAGASSYGIFVHTDCADTAVSNNTLTLAPTNPVVGIMVNDQWTPGSVILAHNSVSGSQYGLQLSAMHPVTLVGNTVTGANVGIQVNSNNTVAPTIHDGNILGNTAYGIKNLASTMVDARNNWWGDPSGPYHSPDNVTGTGNPVTDLVDFGSYLSSAYSCSPDTCPTGTCEIGSSWYFAGETNPINSCLFCDLAAPTVWTPKANGALCTDDNACTSNDTCQAGVCASGIPLNCDDSNQCTTDTCVATSGCVFTPKSCPGAETCDWVTGDCESCAAGGCAIDGVCYPDGTTKPDNICLVCNVAANPNGWTNNNGAVCADDANECTEDTCNAGSCTHPNKTLGTACGTDFVDCTDDVCNGSGACTHAAKSQTPPWTVCNVTHGGSIQNAINATPAGGTVNVGAGTYPEALTIAKALTLQGAGIDQSIIDDSANAATKTALAISGTLTGDLTVDGFTMKITSAFNCGDYVFGITAKADTHTIYLTHNKFLGSNRCDAALYAYNRSANIVFQYNTVTNVGFQPLLYELYTGATDTSHNSFEMGAYGIGVIYMTYNGVNVSAKQTFNDNTFDLYTPSPVNTNPYAGVTFIGGYYSVANRTGGYSSIEIKNNSFLNAPTNVNGIRLRNDNNGDGRSAALSGIDIEDNLFEGSTDPSVVNNHGIYLAGYMHDILIKNNKISGMNDAAIYGIQSPYGTTANVPGAAIAANLNNLADNASIVTWPAATTGAGMLDLSGNWLGSDDPTIVASFFDVDPNLDYTPWLDTGDDQSTDPGFQPDLTYLHVGAAGAQSGTTGRIQEAIGLVSEGGTVEAHAGLYDERILIKKALTLLGATHGVPKKGYPIPTGYAYDPAVETILNPSTDIMWPVIGIGGYAAIGNVSATLFSFGGKVTLDGLVVESQVAGTGGTYPQYRDLIQIAQHTSATSGLEITNCVLGPNTNAAQNGTYGRSGICNAGPTYGHLKLLVNNNKIFDAKGDGCGIMLVGPYGPTYHGGTVYAGHYAGSIIENNEITGNHRSGIELAGGVQGTVADPMIIRDNMITNIGWRDVSENGMLKYGNGLTCQRAGSDKLNADAAGCKYLLVENNEIRDNEKNGIYLGPMNGEMTFTGNLIQNNGSGAGGYLRWDGVRLDLTELYYSTASNGGIGGTPVGYQGVAFPVNLVFQGNNILDNDATRPTPAKYGIKVVQVATNPAGAVVATGNWWGDYTGPYHVSTNTAGLGSPVTDYVLFGVASNPGDPTQEWSKAPNGGLECPGCLIAGVCYLVSQTDPLNVCLICATAGAPAFAPNDGVSCDDGTVCDGADVCNGGTCSLHVNPLDCDDGNLCTDDSCEATAGCQHADNTDPCDDGDACTVNDTCDGGACASGTARNCDDGLYCNGAETCDPAVGCVAASPISCGYLDDHISCTIEECDENTNQCVTRYDSSVNPCVVTAGGKIQDAINIVNPGTTVQVVAGTFAENLTINKYLILDGAGSGADPGVDTIIDPSSGHGITIVSAGSGASATDRTVIKDLRVTGAAQGVRFDSNATIKWVTLNNVATVGNTEPGINLREVSTYEDLLFEDVVSTGNSAGVQIQSTATVLDGLTVDGATLSNNTIAGFLALGGTLTNVAIKNATVQNNASGVGTDADIVLTGFNGNLEISDTAVTSNNAESAIRVSGNGTLAPAGTMSFKNITITGLQAMVGTYPSAALVLTRYTDMAAVSFENVILDSSAPAGLFLGTLYQATTPPALDLDGVSFSGAYPKYIQLGRHGNSTSYSKANATVDATGAVFTGVTDPFAIEDKIDHQLDDAELGLVTWVADNLYVTPTSGSIQRGINAAGATGWTVNVASGTFTERLNVSKSVELRGAQYGNDPTPVGERDNPLVESILTDVGMSVVNPNVLVEIPLGVSGVKIDGFTLKSIHTSPYADSCIVRAWDDDLSILNNIFDGWLGILYKGHPNTVGVDFAQNRMTINKNGIVANQGTFNKVTIEGNTFALTGSGDAADAAGINLSTCDACTVHGNKANGFTGNNGLGGSGNTNLTITDNDFSGNKTGINLWGTTNQVTIQNNKLDNNTSRGIAVKGKNITIVDNQITGCGDAGVYISENVGTTENVAIHNSNIFGNANYGVQVDLTKSSPVSVDATSNWWGNYTGPRHPSNPNGLGDAVTDRVNYGTVLAKPAGTLPCPGCEVAGVCYLVSQTDPLNVCLICATAGATAFVPNDGVSCDDGTVCDGADTCSGGTCSLHVNPLDCNDGNPCTDDACDMVAGCVNVANAASCDDGVWCNGADTCENKTCTVHAGDPCPENSNVCDGITSCDEGADQCVTTAALTCDDGNPCTDDSCAPTTGCTFNNDDTNTCDDGQFCTDNDACTAGVCGGTAHSCDDKVTCTDDACNETNDTCDYTANGQDCEVGSGGNIQNALDAADPGDVVLLADAIFPVDDPLVISKSLILRGQGTGTTTIDGGANPGDYGQTCDAGGVGDNWPRGILVTANNVTIDHLKIKNFQGDRTNCYGYGVLARGAESYSGVPGGTILTGLHLHEVEFVDTTLGARLSETDGAIIEDSTYEVINGEPADSFHLNYSTNALIQNNTLTDGDIWVAKGSHNARILNNHITDAPANCIWAGVNFTGLDLSNSPTIVGNTLDGCFEGGIVLWGKTGEVTTNALIADNTITGVEGGPAGYDDHGGISIFAGEYTNLIVRDNDSSNNLGDQAGLYIRSAKLNSATITGNKFSHNLGRGVWINKVTRVAVDLRYNSIYGNALGGVEVAAGSGTDVDARQSWWGDATGPYHASLNPHGLGNSVSNYVLFGDYDTAEPGTVAPACRGDAGQICLTNVSTRQFTVSWSTFGANEKGYLKYGTSPTNLNQTASDDRGAGIYDENHHITLASLPTPPGTTYYYEVVSGGVTHRNGAQPFSVTTAPSIGIPAFDDKMMQVFLQDGATASKGTLVYAKLKNDLAEAPNPSLGESAWLSTVLKDDDGGVWGVPLGNFREANLGAYFSYEGTDNIFVFADGAQDGFSTYEGNIADDIPSIILNNCDGCFINQVCYTDGTKPTPTSPLVDTCEICDITRSRSTWSPVAAATLCRPEATICDVAESCDGTHTYCPTDAFASTATVCRPVAGICDVVEMCTGTSSVCPVDAFVAPTVECRASSGICDVAENCTGTGALCPSDEVKPSGTECRAKADFCDVAESCDGSAKTCPADAFAPSTLECRAAAGICDVAENCTGGAAACPADAKQPGGTECRAKTAFCDVAESCDGTANTCPVDAFVPAGTVCNAASTDPEEMCDADDVCAGTSAACIEKWKPSTQSCRTAVNNCDVTEFCTGSLKTCPVDGFQPTSFMCNAKGSDPCDADDYCAGDSATCTPMFAPSSTVCRAIGSQGSAVDCDIAEYCSGDSLGCPADAFQPAGSTCNDGQSCTSPDQCNGTGVCAGPPNSGPFVSVTAPAVAANYPGGGGTANITWNYGVCPVGGSNGVAGVDIKASLDGGATYPVLIATDAPDSGSYAWTLPAINESRLRIKVEAKKSDGSISGNDAMDGNFTVYMPVSIDVTVGTDGKVTLTWAGGAADVYWSTKPFSANPADWQLFAQNVTSGWKDLTSAAIADTYYRLANTGKTALSAEIAGKTKTTLASGYTLITPHFQHAGTIKAQDILDQIGTTAKSIMRWDAGAQWWNIHYRQYPTYNNFVIEPGVGYFIEINGASTYWTTSGLLIQDLFTAPFSFDYTLMGFPTGEWEKAQNVLTEVTNQGGTGNSIYGWDSGSQWWNIHYNQYPTNNNFAIEIDEGYFVKNTNYSGLIADFDFNPLDLVVLKYAGSFNVSWTSKLDATGWLLFYGTNPANTPVVVFDDSDLYFDRDTEHSVTVEGLSAGTYYYDIVMSGVAFNLNGNHHVVTLP